MMTKLRTSFLLVLPACAVALLCGAEFSAHAATAAGWQATKNTALGFAVARPAGWTVQADSRSILVQSRDRTETVLMEVFTAAPGDSATAHLTGLSGKHAALFPQASVSGLVPQPSAGEEVSGTLHYYSASGPGQGRVLCSVIHGKGLLFALAAPGTKFPAAQPTLMRIVRSLRFMAPRTAAVTRPLHYVSWTDPREQAFHVAVPQGWKAEGGAFRFGPTDVRTAYQVMSPDKGMSVVVGDPRLPSTFQAPIAFTESTGMGDGTNGLLHYMPAVEFNRWYLEDSGRQVLDHLTVGSEHPMTEVSRRQTEAMRQQTGGAVDVEASMAITEFSGRSKETGKQITGIIIGTTQRRTNTAGGMESTTWSGSPMILACTDDAAKSRSQQTVLAVLNHLMQTYRENPAWIERRMREIEQATGQVLKRNADRSRQIAQNSDDARSASMRAYWGHEEASGEQQRGFVNYMGNRTDVVGAEGVSHSVQSGSKHHYQGQNGTIIGTDSEYSPGVDFTPMTER